MIRDVDHSFEPFHSAPVLGAEFFRRPFLEVARGLIGATLHHGECVGRIVEVEAYAVEGDAACHTATRRASREFVEQYPPGTAYVYLNYGVHWLLNVLARDGIVLFRAVEPLAGLDLMRKRRGTESVKNLCSGPGKLAKAFGFSAAHHGADLTGGVFRAGPPARIITDVRIGITKAADYPWRFLEADSPWISVKPGSQKVGVPPSGGL